MVQQSGAGSHHSSASVRPSMRGRNKAFHHQSTCVTSALRRSFPMAGNLGLPSPIGDPFASLRAGASPSKGAGTMADELWRFGASELAALIHKGEVSSSEVVAAHLERIGQVNPAVNAVTITLADEAL